MKSTRLEIILLIIVLFIAVAANEGPLAYGQKDSRGFFLYPPIYPKSYANYDGWVRETGENTNVGGTVNVTGAINLGDDAGNQQYIGILHFNTASYHIPPTAVIYNAVLRIRRQSIVGSNPFLSFGVLYVDIRKPSFGTAPLTSTDFQAVAGRSAVAAFGRLPVSGWYKAIINATGRAYINKSGVTQFRLRFKLDDNNNFVRDYVTIYSGDALTNLRPTLELNYYVP
jgi:hypothetical protein